MPLPEQQEYIDQISLHYAKLNHLEETLKIEEQENKLRDNLKLLEMKSKKEAEMVARKEQEKAAELIELQKEEGDRRNLVKKMMTKSDSALSPITNVIVNFEGIDLVAYIFYNDTLTLIIDF